MDEKSSESSSVSEKNNDQVEDINTSTKHNEDLSRKNKRKTVDKKIKKTSHASKKTLDSILHQESLSFSEHQMSTVEVAEKYGTRLKIGLDAEERLKRQETYGRNVFPDQSSAEFVKWLKELFGWFGILLWLGASLSIIGFFIYPTGDFTNLYVGIVLVAVALLLGTLSYIYNSRLEYTLKKIQKISHQATVLINGKLKLVDITDLVVGDLVFVSAGDMIPADIRIVECQPNFKIDFSSLLPTKTQPQIRTVENTEENPLRATNLAFCGTFVTEGSAYGIVLAIGRDTLKYRVSKRIQNNDYPWSNIPIFLKMDRLVLILTAIAILLCVLLFTSGLIIARGTNIIPNIVFMIGVLVAMVSQGLFLTLTLALTLTLRKLARKRVHLRKLESLQSFNSVTTICTDKTAFYTLMDECSHLWYDEKLFDANTIINDKHSALQSPTFRSLLKVAILNSRAHFEDEESEIIGGSFADKTLIQFCRNVQSSTLKYRAKYPKKFETSFSRHDESSIVINQIKQKGFLLTIRGSPEQVLNKCTHVITKGKVKPLSSHMKKSLDTTCNELYSKGENVLVFAQKMLDQEEFPLDFEFQESFVNQTNLCKELTLVGFISFRSSPKPLVSEALQRCQEIGIKIILWSEEPLSTWFTKCIGLLSELNLENTSDHTQQMHLNFNDDTISKKSIIVSGVQIRDLTQHDWDQILDRSVIVFIGVSSQQKLSIIHNFQKRGQIVAFIGENIEDRVSFLEAHVKITMGSTRNALFKETSDVLLLDDNFASLVKSIEKGNLLFNNLRKSIAYILSSNLPKMIPFFLFVWVGLPFPLTTVLVLCVDISTNILPAISLLYEAPERTLKRGLNRTMSLFNGTLISFSYCQVGVIESLAALFAYFVVLGSYGFSPFLLPGTSYYWEDPSIMILDQSVFYRREALNHAQTAFFIAILVNQWINLIICKTRHSSVFQHGMLFNKILLLALITETAFACLIIYVPGLNFVFGTRPLIFLHWLPGLPFAILLFCYDEMRKCIIRSYPQGIFRMNAHHTFSLLLWSIMDLWPNGLIGKRTIPLEYSN